ncbi:MAG: peptidyl-prolyl cis-trans isomerase [Treponema sp.]|nr:peptidyl-prolyl cis-trans isomerase [Candidatus Treponema equifaecale]
MKRLAICLSLLFALAGSVFAQADLQPLVVVKLNKSETITLKKLKARVETYQKQTNQASFTVDQKKDILNAMVDELLVVQAAQKAGMNLTDTQVNQYFMANLSQQVGRQVTESEFAEIVKKNTNLSLDDYMKQQVGMNVADYKAYLKNQLLAQQYVLSQKQSEIQNVAPTDENIRSFFEMNKASFVQSDMLKLFLVVVPKGNDPAAAKAKLQKIYDDLKAKKLTYDSIKTESAKDMSYQGGDLLIQKSAQHAQQLGISYNDLIELFGRDNGYTSNVNETATDFQFYVVRQKYAAKMLGLSDVVQPETTVTVYDYIKQNLTQQMQSQALVKAVSDITKSLDTPSNVDRKKTGDALNKLLNW